MILNYKTFQRSLGLLTILGASVILMSLLIHTPIVDAAIQLIPSEKPADLPDLFTSVSVDEAGSSEQAISQSIIFTIGTLLSRVLLFVGAIGIIFFVIAGANYILAFGKDERIEQGKRGIFWAFMGLLVIMFSYAIVQAVLGLLLTLDSGTPGVDTSGTSTPPPAQTQAP